MVGDYNLECCIGIKHIECIDILFNYIEKEDCIDKINLLIATRETLEHIKNCVTQHPKITNKITFSIYKNIDNPDEIRKKYKNNNTIYIYLDDDICYLSPNMINKLAIWHTHNQHIISFPSIVNTGTTTFIWQVMNILPIFKNNSKIKDTDYCWVDCANLSLQNIITIHEKFIDAITHKTNLSFHKYYLYHSHEIYKQCYMWSSSENCQVPCAKLFEQYPEKFCINGEVIASHFSFQEHRTNLNKTNLLNQYTKLY